MIIIDRIEGDYAVVEAGEQMLHIAIAELPQEAAEGDILTQTESGWLIDVQATQARREAMAARRARLLEEEA
ncbi:MAG: DUF3006 domain-containing protein [Ruminococcus sp.]|nr:DUF3006 domain-containing protein [Ruminococcus sp.]